MCLRKYSTVLRRRFEASALVALSVYLVAT